MAVAWVETRRTSIVPAECAESSFGKGDPLDPRIPKNRRHLFREEHFPDPKLYEGTKIDEGRERLAEHPA